MRKLLIASLMSLGLYAGSVPVTPLTPVVPVIPVETSIPLYVAVGGSYEQTQFCCNGNTLDADGYSAFLEGGYIVNDYVSIGVRGLSGFNTHASAVARIGTNNDTFNVGVVGGYGYTENDYNDKYSALYGAYASYNVTEDVALAVEATQYNEYVDAVGVYLVYKF